MRIVRRPDWRSAFHHAIDLHRGAPFQWGEHDCIILSADCVRAIDAAAIDRAAGIRGRYRSSSGALRLLKEAGFSDAAEAVAAQFGEIHPSLAQVGDLAVVPTDDGPAIGPVTGSMIAVFVPAGLAFVSLSTASRAFEV